MHSFIVGYVRWSDRSNTYWCTGCAKACTKPKRPLQGGRKKLNVVELKDLRHGYYNAEAKTGPKLAINPKSS